MDNPRTQSARDNDDSELIDSVEPTPPQGGSSGGNLQEDVATQAELDHQQRYEKRHPADKSPGGNPSE
jgi:hypothetical protein